MSGQKLDAARDFEGKRLIELVFPTTPLKPTTAVLLDADGVATDKLLIGQGFNPATGEEAGTNVVVPGELTTVGGGSAEGQDTTYRLRRLTSLQEVSKMLNLSAAASAGFGIFHADAAYQYMSSSVYSEFSSYLCVDVDVVNPTRVLRESKLSPAALSALARGFDAFFEYAGSAYVYGLQTGGHLSAIVRFESTTVQEHQQTNTSIDASVSLFMSGHADIQTTFSSLSQFTSTDITLLRKGTLDAIPTFAELIPYALNFPTHVAREGAKVTRVLLREYTTVENNPGGLNYALVDKQAKTMAIIAGYLSDAYELNGKFNYWKNHPEQFDYKGDLVSASTDAIKETNEIIQDLLDAATEVKRNPAAAAPAKPTYPEIDGVTRVDPRPRQPVLEMWENMGYTGRYWAANDSIPNFVAIGCNDMISSLRINGGPGQHAVAFYLDAGYQNLLVTLTSPTDIGNLHTYFVNFGAWNIHLGDKISAALIS